MADTILFIADDCVDVDVFHTPEDVSPRHTDLSFSARAISFLISMRFETLEPVRAAGRAGVGEAAGALDEVQIVVHRASALMSSSRIRYIGRISSMPGKFVLWSFGIMVWTWRAVEHAHENRLDHVVIVMPQRDLVAAELLGIACRGSRGACARRDSRAIFPHCKRSRKCSFRKSVIGMPQSVRFSSMIAPVFRGCSRDP